MVPAVIKSHFPGSVCPAVDRPTPKSCVAGLTAHVSGAAGASQLSERPPPTTRASRERGRHDLTANREPSFFLIDGRKKKSDRRPGADQVKSRSNFTVPPGCQRCGSSRRTRRAKRAAREAGCAAAKSTRTIETVPSKRRGSFLTSAPVERPQLPNPWEGDDRSQDPLGGRRAAANLRETIRIVPNERLIVSERVAARDRNFAHVNAEVRELAQMQI